MRTQRDLRTERSDAETIGWLERIHEADRRVAHAHPAVFHARAHVEQQQRGDWLAVSGEDRDVRGLAVVEHLEVLLAEIGDEPALRSCHQGVDRDHVDVRPKDLLPRKNSQNERCDDGGGHFHGMSGGLRWWTDISFHRVYAGAPTMAA